MSMTRYPYIIVVIPAYNEEESIGALIKKIKEEYIQADTRGYWLDIIVVNDGSRDKTAQVAKECGVKLVVHHSINRGLGAATRIGLQRAYELGADVAVKIDADFQHDPADIDKLVKPILEDWADCVFGSRLRGGLQYNMPLYRAVGNRFFSWLVSWLTGLKITDAQTGLMAFSKRYLKDFKIVSDYNETQQLIMDACGRNMRIIEVPVVFHRRKKGKSFISWRYPFRVLPVIIRLFVEISPLKVFLPMGILSILFGVFIAISVTIAGKESFFGDATISILIVGGIQIILFGLLADKMTKRS